MYTVTSKLFPKGHALFSPACHWKFPQTNRLPTLVGLHDRMTSIVEWRVVVYYLQCFPTRCCLATETSIKESTRISGLGRLSPVSLIRRVGRRGVSRIVASAHRHHHGFVDVDVGFRRVCGRDGFAGHANGLLPLIFTGLPSKILDLFLCPLSWCLQEETWRLTVVNCVPLMR